MSKLNGNCPEKIVAWIKSTSASFGTWIYCVHNTYRNGCFAWTWTGSWRNGLEVSRFFFPPCHLMVFEHDFISKPLNWRADPETQLDLLNKLCPFQFANWCTGRGNSNDSGRWRCFNGKNIDNLIDISLTEKWNASQNNLYLFHCQMLFRVFIIRWVIISCYQFFFFVLIGCWNWKWKNGGKKYIYKNHGCNTYSLQIKSVQII